MRLRPNDDRIESMPMARGYGIFASELDAAVDDILADIPAENREDLRRQVSDGLRGVHDDWEPYEGSGATDFTGASERAHRDVIVPMAKLYDLAMLVTGRWGRLALPEKEERTVGPSGAVKFERRRRLDIYGSKPGKNPGPFRRMSFRDRMQELENALTSRLADAEKAYKKRAKLKTGSYVPDSRARKQMSNWIGALSQMRSAVRYVRGQLLLPPSERSVLVVGSSGKKVPLGVRWGVLAGDGNSKLPFLAYSELPMATCPGAGACGVYKKDVSTGTAASGWCYSFKAWRYPSAFARQFLNTLAASASRVFAIERSIGDGMGGIDYWTDVEAGIVDLEREWQQYVKVLVLRKAASVVKVDLRKGRRSLLSKKDPVNSGRVVFFRLFVDGDMGDPDSVACWMQAIRQMADATERDEAIGAARAGELGPIQAYGYSKAWGEFVYVDQKLGRSFWPTNYTLNLSNASTYAGSSAESLINELPITRGYFNAVDFRSQLRAIKKIDPNKLALPDQPPLPGVTVDQMRGMVELGDVATAEEAEQLLLERFGVTVSQNGFHQLEAPSEWPVDETEREAARREYERERVSKLRGSVLHAALAAMLSNERVSRSVREEIARDDGFYSLEAAEKSYRKGGKKNPTTSVGRQQRKLVALLVHSIFAAASVANSGSCPLICGNCSDLSISPEERAIVFSNQKSFEDFQAVTGAVHRCASRVPTLGYVPVPGKTLPTNMKVARDADGVPVARGYRRLPSGRVELSVGYYGADIHIGLH